jgi:hypothetical protein
MLAAGYREMSTAKHQWALFSKGRMKIKACSICGDVHLPSNSEAECNGQSWTDSRLAKAGFKPITLTSKVA